MSHIIMFKVNNLTASFARREITALGRFKSSGFSAIVQSSGKEHNRETSTTLSSNKELV